MKLKNLSTIISAVILVFGTVNSYAQGGDFKIENEKAEVTIKTGKEFKLSYTDTSITSQVHIGVTYNSKTDTYAIKMQRLDNASAVATVESASDIKADKKEEKDSADDDEENIEKDKNGVGEKDKEEHTFKISSPLSYQVLKGKVNAWAIDNFQEDFEKKKAITDACASRIYLWLYHIRHFDDKAPVTGELVLNSMVMVHERTTSREYNDYNRRMGFIHNYMGRYASANADLASSKANLNTVITQALKKKIEPFVEKGQQESQRYEKLQMKHDSLATVLDTFKTCEMYYNQSYNWELDYEEMNRYEKLLLDTKCDRYRRLKQEIIKLEDSIKKSLSLKKDFDAINTYFKYAMNGNADLLRQELYEAKNREDTYKNLEKRYNCINLEIKKLIDPYDLNDIYEYIGDFSSVSIHPFLNDNEALYYDPLEMTISLNKLDCSSFEVNARSLIENNRGELLNMTKEIIRHYGESTKRNDNTIQVVSQYINRLISNVHNTTKSISDIKESINGVEFTLNSLNKDRYINFVLKFILERERDELAKEVSSLKQQHILIRYLGENLLFKTLENYENIKKKNAEANQALNEAKKVNIYEIDKMRIQFERGFLTNIMVWVTINDQWQEIFENNYAIGFSSISNYRAFKQTRLYPRNSSDPNQYIYLSDVFANYENMLYSYTRDYSPADTAINDIIPLRDKVIPLKKDRLVNLFDTKIYTDLRGLSDETPNGLVQVEARKQFNINTSRRPLGMVRSNWGYFNYLNLYGALTKIEEQNRELILRNDRIVQNNTLVSPSYATNLDIRNYENMSAGIDANLLLFDFPDFKYTIFLNTGFRWGLLQIRDTVLSINNNTAQQDGTKVDDFQANTLSIFPEVKFEILSEKRVGFTLGYQFIHTFLFSNNRFKQVASYEKSPTTSFFIEPNARKSHSVELLIRILPAMNADNKFFLRGRFFWQEGDVSTSFSQIQFGYSYNLFYKK